jgi:hypothetical protein
VTRPRITPRWMRAASEATTGHATRSPGTTGCSAGCLPRLTDRPVRAGTPQPPAHQPAHQGDHLNSGPSKGEHGVRRPLVRPSPSPRAVDAAGRGGTSGASEHWAGRWSYHGPGAPCPARLWTLLWAAPVRSWPARAAWLGFIHTNGPSRLTCLPVHRPCPGRSLPSKGGLGHSPLIWPAGSPRTSPWLGTWVGRPIRCNSPGSSKPQHGH